MIKEAIILAGGLGTRLRSVVHELPKCMAPVAGRPFISHVTDYYLRTGIERFIFALGYKSEYFEEFLQNHLPAGSYRLSVEGEPLGTGGAIRLACESVEERHVMVLNGDTFFRVDPEKLSAFHLKQQDQCTLCLKPMRDFDRYGVVELDETHRVRLFREKQFYETGLINGGVYALDSVRFLEEGLPEKFSFEKDYLGSFYQRRKMSGLVQDGYFIDIGIPADYEKAQQDFSNTNIQL